MDLLRVVRLPASIVTAPVTADICVDANALRLVLLAFYGRPGLVMDMLAGIGFPLPLENPIEVLSRQYTAAIDAHNALHDRI